MRTVWLLVAALVLAPFARADEPAKKYQVVSPKDDGIMATGINGRGEIVGFEWVEPKDQPGVLVQAPFFAKGKEMTYLPLLKGYTAIFPASVSDDGLVVGRASKDAPLGARVSLRNQAFVWSIKTGMHGLGALSDDAASFACGITRDGRRISGYSVGDNRIRACIWERDGDGWKGIALPQSSPQLGSTVVAMSDNGKCVAAVDGALPCLWSDDACGEWKREVIAYAGSLVPRSVNNSGMVVGLRFSGDGLSHAVLWSREGGYKQLEKPEGYVRSEANAVNNEGVVVGSADGPAGSKNGPTAFVYQLGRLRLMDEGGPDFTSATAINDRGQVAGVLEKEEKEAQKEVDRNPQAQGTRP